MGVGNSGHPSYMRVNPCAVLSLMFAIGVPIPLAAFVFGVVAQRQISESNGNERGHAMAISGIVLGLVELVGVIILIVAIAHGSQSPCDPSSQSC